MVFGTALAKGAAFIAQIVLGWLLLQEDFGLYFTALAVAGFVQVMRDGGVREVLVQRGAAAYANLAGPVFWLALAMNVAAGAILAGLAPVIAGLYEEPRLTPLLLVIAVSLPLSTPAAILLAKLRIDLRFGVVSRISIVSAIARHGGTIALAYWLKSPMAFVLPLILVAVVEWAWAWWATREERPPWMKAARVREWIGLLKAGYWMIVQTLANVLLDVGSFAVLGLIVTQAVVGTYGFAFNWIAQVGVLLSFNMQQVLFPALTRVQDDPARLRDATLRSLRALMLVAAISCLGLAAVMEPLEKLLWHGKWEAAVVPVMVLGVFFAFRVSFGLCAAVLMAAGRFRAFSFLTMAEGVGVMAAGAIGAAIHGDATGIAMWTGAQLAIGRLVATVIVLKPLGIGAGEVLRAGVPAWLLATLAAAAAVMVDRSGGVQSVLAGIDVARLVSGWGASLKWAQRLDSIATEGARMLVISMACAGLFAVAARVLIAGQVSEALDALPGRVGRPVRAILRLRA